jgi:hypothetical protein
MRGKEVNSEEHRGDDGRNVGQDQKKIESDLGAAASISGSNSDNQAHLRYAH